MIGEGEMSDIDRALEAALMAENGSLKARIAELEDDIERRRVRVEILNADKQRLRARIAEHEQFLELLDSGGVKMKGRGIRESWATLRKIAGGNEE
jgi:hypothetical protein